MAARGNDEDTAVAAAVAAKTFLFKVRGGLLANAFCGMDAAACIARSAAWEA